MAMIFKEQLGVADIFDNYLKYKDGYSNSLTCFQGFGPSPHSHIHTFDGLVKEKENNSKVAVVLREQAAQYLVMPDKIREFEYLSLALHSFIAKINVEDIVGYVITKDNLETVQGYMKDGKMKSRKLWIVEDVIGATWLPSEAMSVDYYLK